MSPALPALLAPDEPPACTVQRPDAASPWLLLCDHAGNRIPRSLGTLGLGPADLQRHIAWDLGAAALTTALGEALEATAILQPYSRLVVDCNRPPESAESIVTRSEHTDIAGNHGLTAAQREQRVAAVWAPYHAGIAAHLAARRARGQATGLLALHSFTPVYAGVARPWHAGVLFNRDGRLALALAAALKREPGLVVGINEPYSVSDETDVAIPRYGEQGGLPHVELEIRQDELADAAGIAAWAQRLARMLRTLQDLLAP